jgi:hypothetical protein
MMRLHGNEPRFSFYLDSVAVKLRVGAKVIELKAA